ncbi:photosystem II complex extrinsic protein PsbU [Spirulina subsalsa FACHB-351]|uniref:Photosystem II extrinsic protein U n=1 Tax=Spirulina subsalsa FACHB-351 TaxID=234711 RepID=A0ABT3L5Y2_9CYAN|nr:photosystem II complex extrinsic protein PsbU [Spirulina subsalsa]MCW6036920.1 photosystem II complex extrinsic protein PsbU [Spirulina subsalsa FACHB-351]
MKKLASVIAVIALVLGFCGFLGQQQAIAGGLNLTSSTMLLAEYQNPADAMLQTEFGKKIDLNNTNVRAFRKLKGFYPSLASKIVENAPYQKVEDVLNIPGLSEGQKERLQANLENFTVLDPVDVFVEGGDRFNNGYY